MAIAKRQTRPPKKVRIETHIKALRAAITARYPGAKFLVARVPESSWPALYVDLERDTDDDLHDLVREEQEQFFLTENMDVHLIHVAPGELD